MDASTRIDNIIDNNQIKNGQPKYTMPWKAIALVISGIACISFSIGATTASPLLVGTSFVVGVVCFVKSIAMYKLNRGRAEYEYAMTRGDDKMHWLKKSITNRFQPAAVEFTRIFLNQLRELRLSPKDTMEKAKLFVKTVNKAFTVKEKNAKIISLINQDLNEFNFPPLIKQRVQECIKKHSNFTYKVNIGPGNDLDIL